MGVFARVIFALSVGMTGQELTLPEADRNPVPRPQNVMIERVDHKLKIDWNRTPIQRVVAYEIHQITSGENSKLIARIENPPFIMAVPRSRTQFYVIAVDYRNNRSKPSKIVAFVKE